MMKRILALSGFGIGIGLMVCSSPQMAMAQQRATTGAKATTAWTAPKTPWGEPDLQGMWPLNHLLSTPLQRQEKYGNRREMTDEEFAAAKKSADQRNTRFES